MKNIATGIVILLFLALLVSTIGLFRTTQKSTNIKSVITNTATQTRISILAANLPLTVPPDYALGYFARNLGNIRDLTFSPGGILLASVTNEGKILAFPDRDKDGKADDIIEVIAGLQNPHGIRFYYNRLFVAEETKIIGYDWDEQNLKASFNKELVTLPAGGRHVTRSIDFDDKGNLFVSLGSTCDTCNENHPWLAAVMVTNSNGDNPRLFAGGLRNSVFITMNPATGELWGGDMARDNLGDDTPSDEINIIRENKHYGWPNCYGNQIKDNTFNTDSSIVCAETGVPIYEIPAHSAPLGFTFIDSTQFPSDWQGDILMAYHGSWNRSIPIGYKIVRIKVEGNEILGEEDFISGFIRPDSTVIGRPVDLIFDKSGNLYISDDKNGSIYIVNKR